MNLFLIIVILLKVLLAKEGVESFERTSCVGASSSDGQERVCYGDEEDCGEVCIYFPDDKPLFHLHILCFMSFWPGEAHSMRYNGNVSCLN